MDFNKGTFNIGDRIDVNRGGQDLRVNAEGARLVSQDVDGDLIRINSGRNSDREHNITWTGGEFDLRNQKLSNVRPVPETEGADRSDREDRIGEANVSDGLSFRRSDHKANVTVRGVSFRGASDGQDWTQAGGDSGLFIEDVNNALVEDSDFYGLRDAGVYVSDADGTGTGEIAIQNNLFENNYDGATGKRGVDNVKFRNNAAINNAVGISYKTVGEQSSNPPESTGGVISGNFIATTDEASDPRQRSVVIDEAPGGTHRNNTIKTGGVSETSSLDFDSSESRTAYTENSGSRNSGNSISTQDATPEQLEAARQQVGLRDTSSTSDVVTV